MKANEVLQKLLIGAMLVATLLTPTTSMALSKSTIDKFNTYPTTKEQIQSTSTPIYVYVQYYENGERLISRLNLNYPVMVLNNRSAVAVKDITDNLKADLTWDNSNKVATINKDGNEVAYPINKKVMSLNDKVNKIDTNATIYTEENRTYLPFASLADALGMKATWIPKGESGALHNSILLSSKEDDILYFYSSSIQPPVYEEPTVVAEDQMVGDKYLNAEQIEWVYKQWEANGVTRASINQSINDFTKDYKPEKWQSRRERYITNYYRDIAVPKGWDKKIKVHPDLIYYSGSSNYIQGIEFKTENGVKYQRVVKIPVNYTQEEFTDTQGNTYSKLYVVQIASGEPYGHLDWIKTN